MRGTHEALIIEEKRGTMPCYGRFSVSPDYSVRLRVCAACLFDRGFCAAAAGGDRVFPLACVDYAGGDVSAHGPVLAAKLGPLPLIWPPLSGGKGLGHYHHRLLAFFYQKFYDKRYAFKRRGPVFDTGHCLFSGDRGCTFGMVGHYRYKKRGWRR